MDKPKGLDKPWVPTLIKYMSKANVWIYRRTDGRVGGTWRVGAGFRKPVKLALLSHTGRRSGTTYTTPLLFLRDGDRMVFVASQGGLPKHPQWYLNLVATPQCTVQVRSETRHMVARTAEPAERAELWPRLNELYADFDSYQSWVEREIPVVICDPA